MLDRELAIAVRYARDAGDLLLSQYRGAFDVDYKDSEKKDPVTSADRMLNQFLVQKLEEAFPSDQIVAEESTDPGSSSGAARVWYIDPIDGTKEFVAKNGEFSIMIGLSIRGTAQLGVVYQPTEDKLFRGVVGDGAFVEIRDQTYVLTSDSAAPSALRLAASRSHRSPLLDTFRQRLSITEEVVSGSLGLKVGLVLQKKADVYFHPADRISAWDACAPDALMRAAGGVFVDGAGEALVYSGSLVRNRKGIVACSSAVHDVVAGAAREITASLGT